MADRLFCPLTTDAFEDYKLRGKNVEIRKYGARFNERHIYYGRDVEFRKGYSGESINRVITDNIIIGSLEKIFSRFELKNVEPRFKSIDAAILDNINLLGNCEKYIAFETVERPEDI